MPKGVIQKPQPVSKDNMEMVKQDVDRNFQLVYETMQQLQIQINKKQDK